MRRAVPSPYYYLVLTTFAVLASPLPAAAATPPALVNYQGVLRDASDRPESGTFDMTFSFYDAQSAGTQILVDGHTSGNANPVTVAGGLFNVQLGGGTVADGSGPGTYTSLAQVFGDFAAVWMEIRVGAETLSPRIRVQAEPYALNASNLEGRSASGFLDTSAAAQTKAGHLIVNNGLESSAASGYGIISSGGQTGGGFSAGGAFAYVADTGFINTGIRAQGNDAGGWFRNGSTSSEVYAAHGGYGIDANGPLGGGAFGDSLGDATEVASGGYGLIALGSYAGGVFNPASLSTRAVLGYTGYAVDASASSSLGAKAGRFIDNTTGALVYLGDPTWGVYSSSSTGGAFLSSVGNSSTTIANGNWGLHAVGRFCGVACGGGGFFQDSNPSGATAYVAYNDVGIETHASGSGGSFYNTNGIATAVAAGSFGVSSNGTKSFLQNHPEDPSAVIAYTALEGDEAGTYTRGTARILDGEARIPLGETFKWVTNPDIGLTAHLTPVGGWADLYVASKSTEEIVVRSRDPRAGNVAFDYIVFGLRIGFEDNPVVRDKEHDMPIPASASGESVFAKKPGRERFTALSRFRGMRDDVAGGSGPPDMSASQALKSKIHVFDARRDGGAFRAPVPPPSVSIPPRTIDDQGPASGASSAAPAAAPIPAAAPAAVQRDPEPLPFPSNASPVIVDGSARAGDVVTVTDAPEGEVTLATRPMDRGVVGILGGAPGASWSGRAPLVLAGVVALCNVDATERAVAVGDLLVPSATPGHAMRADANPPPGTVIAKALEALESGTAAIRVLVLSR